MAFQYPGFQLNAFQITRRGAAAGVLPALTGSATAAFLVYGDQAATLPALNGTAEGARVEQGNAIGTGPSLSGSATGQVQVTGTSAATLPPLNGEAEGVRVEAGSGAGTIPTLAGTASGFVQVTGTSAATLPPLNGQAEGARVEQGSGEGTIPTLSGTGTGTFGFVSAGTLPALEGSGQGQVVVAGEAAGVMPALLGNGQGSVDTTVGATPGIARRPETYAEFLERLNRRRVVTGVAHVALPSLSGEGHGTVRTSVAGVAQGDQEVIGRAGQLSPVSSVPPVTQDTPTIVARVQAPVSPSGVIAQPRESTPLETPLSPAQAPSQGLYRAVDGEGAAIVPFPLGTGYGRAARFSDEQIIELDRIRRAKRRKAA